MYKVANNNNKHVHFTFVLWKKATYSNTTVQCECQHEQLGQVNPCIKMNLYLVQQGNYWASLKYIPTRQFWERKRFHQGAFWHFLASCFFSLLECLVRH